ncbi:MAG: chemotaxis protein CheB [Deltaproteobacteria bacterium]|nr:MAG: chemotaxis protein CheB [Deltaproteobacteria bacterium]
MAGASYRRDIVAIGASSGGIEALTAIVAALPRDLPASLFIVLHVAAQSKSQLPEILNRAGPLPAAHAKDNEAIQSGRIYVAPPNYHLLLGQGHVRIVRGPRENNHRPAIDPLFRSAARFYGRRAIGIVLSGMLDDGAAGLIAIKKAGGIAMVQDPNDALFPDMPRNALTGAPVDYCIPKSEIPKTIVSLIGKSFPEDRGIPMADEMKKEIDIVAMDEEAINDADKPGTPSVFGCPDCGGVLWELQDDEWLRFRCRVGHAYSAEGLLASQGEDLDQALWNAFRVLHENAALARRLAERARKNNQELLVEKFETGTREAERRAELIRDLLISGRVNAAGDGGSD